MNEITKIEDAGWGGGGEMYSTDKRIRFKRISKWMEKMSIFLGASFLAFHSMFQNTEHLG